VSGIVWGSASFLLFPSNNPEHQIFLVFILAGLSAGALVSYAADIISSIIFILLVISPLIIRMFLAGDSLSVTMSTGVMLYLGFMIMNLRHINRNVSENIVLHLEAAEREKIAKISEQRYRLLLTHSPVGIFHYDNGLNITYCNDRFANMLHTSIERLNGLDMNTLKDQSPLPALRKALEGELGYYEGHYSATDSDANKWVSVTCSPSLDSEGEIVGGVAIIQDISERKRHEEELRHVAHFDALTGIPNRMLLADRMKQAILQTAREKNMMVVCYLDLDGFKPINDQWGHAAGDQVLIEIAKRIGKTIRGGDTVARLGGDEFVVLLLGHERGKESVSTIERLLAAISLPITVNNKNCSVSASIGVSIYPLDDEDPDILLRHADQAMYVAKQSGKARFHLYNAAMDQHS
jgi:diguanylate cyclase (GGDEF)-like protein/PAS domain S-box-containing protein